MQYIKSLLIVLVVFFYINASAQTSWSTSGNAGTSPGSHFIGTTDNQSLMIKTNATQKMLIDPMGNIQINGDNPYWKINDRFTLQATYTSVNNWTRGFIGSNIRWNGATNLWKVEGGPYDDFAMMRFENNGVIGFYTHAITGASYDMTNNDLYAYQRMFIDNTGKVGIGTDDTKGHLLAVGGSAIFTSAVVKLEQNWPDYVFERDFKLLPLAELEKYIQENKHLPGIPSATEVEKEGLNLGNNQAALLKKIEELTLYIIEQNKRIEQLEAAIKETKSISK